MQRSFWIKVGGKQFHAITLAGAFFVLASVLKLAEASYQIFVAVSKARIAEVHPELVAQLFGWSLQAPYSFSGEDILGVLLGPVAAFLFWFGIAVLALVVYQSGRFMIPVEETLTPEHKRSFHRALLHAKKKR